MAGPVKKIAPCPNCGGNALLVRTDLGAISQVATRLQLDCPKCSLILYGTLCEDLPEKPATTKQKAP
jgi:hypothetical protein